MKQTIPFLLAFLCWCTTYAQTPTARQGIIDLRNWNFSSQGYADLNGEWEFYISDLRSPALLRDSTLGPRDFISFPSLWNDISGSLTPGSGFATYRLKVILGRKEKLGIELPHFYSNYKLWINNREVASNGVVGMTKETSRPQWLPQAIVYENSSDTLDIVIHASNFHHAKGGVREPIRIGRPEDIFYKRTIAINSTGILCGALIILAFAFVAIYFFKVENAALFFAALCITWAIREAFSNIYIVNAAYPDFPWELGLRIEYITLYMTMVWSMLFLSKLFPQDVGDIFKYLFVACNGIFLIFTLFATTSFFTQFLPVYLSIAAILLLYILYVLIHAVVYERKGVWPIVGCTMLGVIVFSYDLISYEGFTSYNSLITHIGYMGMFLLMGLCLTIQLGFIQRSSRSGDMLTYEDLYGKTRK